MIYLGKQLEKMMTLTQEELPVIIATFQKTQKQKRPCVAFLPALLQQL